MKEKAESIIEIIRACQRPAIVISIVGAFTYLSVKLILQFASPEIALLFAGEFLGAATAIIGMLFIDRTRKEKANTKT